MSAQPPAGHDVVQAAPPWGERSQALSWLVPDRVASQKAAATRTFLRARQWIPTAQKPSSPSA